MDNETVSLVSVVTVLVKRRRAIAWTVLIAFLLSVAVSLLLPRWYESTATILPPESSVSQLDVAGLLQSVGIIQPGQLPTMASATDVYRAILGSQTVQYALVDSFDLQAAYGKKSREKGLKSLRKHSDIEVTEEGLIRVTVEDRNRMRAAEIANAYMALLDRFNKESSTGRAKRTREFIEKRLAETESSLQNAERALRDFQQSTGAIALPEQATVSIEAAAELWRQIVELEVALSATAGFESERSPRVMRIRRQIAELKSRLVELNGGTIEGGYEPGDEPETPRSVFLGLRNAPELVLRYGTLLRDVEVQRAVFQFLTRQVEEAKIQEARDTPTIQPLDTGIPAEVAARPRKKVIVAAATGLALLLSIVWSFGIERWERSKLDPASAAQWEAISRSVSKDLARFRRTPGAR